MKCSFFGKWNPLEGVSLDGLGKVFFEGKGGSCREVADYPR
jgi:hypothetical protein